MLLWTTATAQIRAPATDAFRRAVSGASPGVEERSHLDPHVGALPLKAHALKARAVQPDYADALLPSAGPEIWLQSEHGFGRTTTQTITWTETIQP